MKDVSIDRVESDNLSPSEETNGNGLLADDNNDIQIITDSTFTLDTTDVVSIEQKSAESAEKTDEASQSNEESPQKIFIRNFAEIAEPDSDDDEIVLLGHYSSPSASKNRVNPSKRIRLNELNPSSVKTYHPIPKTPRKTITDVAAFDDTYSSLDMVVHGHPNAYLDPFQHANAKRSVLRVSKAYYTTGRGFRRYAQAQTQPRPPTQLISANTSTNLVQNVKLMGSHEISSDLSAGSYDIRGNRSSVRSSTMTPVSSTANASRLSSNISNNTKFLPQLHYDAQIGRGQPIYPKTMILPLPSTVVPPRPRSHFQLQAVNRPYLAPIRPSSSAIVNVLPITKAKQSIQAQIFKAQLANGSKNSMPGIQAGNQKPLLGSVEEKEAEVPNKTFPSLVVQVKTCLGKKSRGQGRDKSRSGLDAKVRSVLAQSPAKFTEWLLRRGTLKLDHFCSAHKAELGNGAAYQLGMYADGNRDPFSGGYVWSAECCPDKKLSVFYNSIFQESKYPPGTILKLLYHWSCQSSIHNILQWVKVSSVFLKNFFALLRAACTAYLHEHCPTLGGELKYVEIGVITLGSSQQTTRGVKNVNVEILGVLDPATKIIRMKVINNFPEFKDKGSTNQDSEQGARAFQILWSLSHWVDKRSILLVDGIIDKQLFHELGFTNIHKCVDDPKGFPSNSNVMNYLRHVLPNIFSNTLCVLSKSIVQQFLDELSWRESYGQSVDQCFESMLDHIELLTKWNLPETLNARLTKIGLNPFVDWSYLKQCQRNPLNSIPLSLRNQPGMQECIRHVMKGYPERKTYPASATFTNSTAPAASRRVPPPQATAGNVAPTAPELFVAPNLQHVAKKKVARAALTSSTTAVPPLKKLKLTQAEINATLNSNFSLPLTTTSKFGRSNYAINFSGVAINTFKCIECKQDMTNLNHFIGRVYCTKCRYITSCQKAMDKHCDNHISGCSQVNPMILTGKVALLEEPLRCDCGYESTHPYRLANHLVTCEKKTVRPAIKN